MRTATYFLILCAIALGIPVMGQVVVRTGTVITASPSTQIAVKDANVNILSDQVSFSNVDLFLTGAVNIDLSTVVDPTNATPFRLRGMSVEGGAEYTLLGAWGISDLLILTNGKLILTGTGNLLTYTGATDVVGSDASYVQGPFHTQGTGVRTFPIGVPSGYFPVRLDDVVEGTAILGFEVIEANPGILAPAGVTAVLTDRYWQMFTRGTGFTGSPISVSINQLGPFLLSDQPGDATLLEVTVDGTLHVLGGKPEGLYHSAGKTAVNGEIYAFGKTEKLTLEILNVLTPNGDVKNNVLQISNIEFFPENTVTLMDRYGVVVHTWTNFKNYSTTDAKQEFDFTSLAIGNYLCVVEYTNLDGSRGSAQQIVTVLK